MSQEKVNLVRDIKMYGGLCDAAYAAGDYSKGQHWMELEQQALNDLEELMGDKA